MMIKVITKRALYCLSLMNVIKHLNLMEETFSSLSPWWTQHPPGAGEGSLYAKCRRAHHPGSVECSQGSDRGAPRFPKQDRLFPCVIVSSRAHSTSLLQITSRHLTMFLCLVVFLLLPGFLSAIQFYKLLGWVLYLPSSFETVIHSVHPLNRILSAHETQKLVSETNCRTGCLPGVFAQHAQMVKYN